MSTTTKSMEVLTNTMTISEIKGFIARLMVKADDVKRQKELISMMAREAVIKRNGTEYSHARQDEQDDLDRVVCMLDNELVNTREAIRVVKAIYHNRRVQQLDENMK